MLLKPAHTSIRITLTHSPAALCSQTCTESHAVGMDEHVSKHMPCVSQTLCCYTDVYQCISMLIPLAGKQTKGRKHVVNVVTARQNILIQPS